MNIQCSIDNMIGFTVGNSGRSPPGRLLARAEEIASATPDHRPFSDPANILAGFHLNRLTQSQAN